MSQNVFVYGSLLSGLHNNYILRGQRKIEDAETEEKFVMLDFGEYPGLINPIDDEEGVIIRGELWTVDDETLTRLDRLESAPYLYDRRVITIKVRDEFEVAWIYLYVDGGRELRNVPSVPSGDWRAHLIMKEDRT